MTGLLSDAHEKTASISTIMNGFKITGIWSVDRTVFSETDFIASNALFENDSEKASEDSEAEDLPETTPEPKDDATEPPVYSDSTAKTKIATQEISIPLLKKFTLYPRIKVTLIGENFLNQTSC
ncbi:unnamed protein product [Acanthoscelides obtectus]|uniref:Uncharacterized protein n=1 Tax=Acanthoscelides obtectus TaxID=200917 RepID=A0A9P0L4W0_ACAOB|nr:unnamed protein product [Acanthoscelides obtectus]CAK1649725.1 hypothetical protein AOBTE_LOCUS16382 [Acanthoscelides obtectus]